VAPARAGFADDDRIVPFSDELEGVQLKAGRARPLRIEAPVEVRHGDPFVQPALLVAPVHQVRAAKEAER